MKKSITKKSSTKNSIIKEILYFLGCFLTVYLLGTALFIGLFHTSIFHSIEVLMYRGIALLLLSSIIIFIVLLYVKRRWLQQLILKDLIMLVTLYLCINMVLFILIPVTVERSVSVFMLSYMDSNADYPFTEEEIAEVFEQKYVNEYGAFEKRIKEQRVTGTIDEAKDGYVITDKGKRIVAMFRIVGKLFGTDERLLQVEE